MKVFVTGVNGQLGHDVIKLLNQQGFECAGSGSSDTYRGINDEVAQAPYIQLDVRDSESVKCVLKEYNPDAIVHCAAWTNVETAEAEENYDRVYAINTEGTINVAEACREIDCKMLYISTDYVFGENGVKPHKADDTNYAPLNVYGKTKLLGELAVKEKLEKYFIVRTSWLFGQNGSNFVKSIINAGKKFGKVYVVNDQIGTPTYSMDLAQLLIQMIQSDKYGDYHASNEGGYISWYDFTCEIFRQAGLKSKVLPVKTENYTCTKVKRPFNSRLDKHKLIENDFTPLPTWENALKRFLPLINIDTLN